jgi:hypothetical protein
LRDPLVRENLSACDLFAWFFEVLLLSLKSKLFIKLLQPLTHIHTHTKRNYRTFF